MFPSLPRTLDAAVRDLGATKPAVRIAAVRDLVPHAAVGRDRVIRALAGALRDAVAEVRSSAAAALADVDGKEAEAALLVAADDPAASVRQMVVVALGEIGGDRATARLREALSDREAEVRFQATIAFPRLAATLEEAMEALAKATHDDDELVCHIALRMAEEIAHDEGAPIDPRMLARARALLTHGGPAARVASAILLTKAALAAGEGDRVDRPVREVLIAVALGELTTREGEDEAAAIELCGELGLKAARPGLEKSAFGGLVLRKSRFAWHAQVALARMGHARAKDEILRDLGSWDRDKRTLAVAAAGRARLGEARGVIAAMRDDESRADPHAVAEALSTLPVFTHQERES